LDVSVAPAGVGPELAAEAERIGIATAETLGVVGLLCVEMFVLEDSQERGLLINEVAPRPHNSGHLTIEACQTSQFEQHVRAICGMPLGATNLVAGAGAMANLLGDLWPGRRGMPPFEKALQVEGVRLHLYGKRDAKPGRKMGHLTALGTTVDQARRRVIEARQALLEATGESARESRIRRTIDRPTQ
jgi:5-(carboxyamino)imidazole ribonucleotide synthase